MNKEKERSEKEKKEVIEQVDFEIVPDDSGLELTAKNSLELAFSGFFVEAARWKEEAGLITDPKLARTARLEMKALRVAAEKKRKELKADSLRMGKAIDGANNILLSQIVPIEKGLEEIEKAEERRIAIEKGKLEESRKALYMEFHDADTPLPVFGDMTEEQFSKTLNNAKTLHEIKAKEAARLEAERIEREKKEAEEREAQRLENIRLKKEAEAREKAMAEEREAAEKLRKEAEAKAAKERALVEAKAKKEAEAREKAEAEARQLKEVEEARLAKIESEKAEAKKAEADRVAKEKAEAKKRASAPDKEKLVEFANQIALIEVPSVKSEDGQKVANEITDKVASFSAWIKKQAATL